MKIFLKVIGLILFCHCAVFNAWAQEQAGPPAEAETLGRDLYKKLLDASELQKKVLNYQVQKYGVDSVETLRPVEALGWMSMQLGDYNTAEVLYTKALKLRTDKMPPSPENTKYIGIAHFMLGEINFLRDRYILAEDHYDRSIHFSADPDARGDAWDRKGKIYKTIGDFERAVSHYLKAVEEYKMAPKSKKVDERIKSAYQSLTEVYSSLGLRLKAAEYQALVVGMDEEMKKGDGAE